MEQLAIGKKMKKPAHVKGSQLLTEGKVSEVVVDWISTAEMGKIAIVVGEDEKVYRFSEDRVRGLAKVGTEVEVRLWPGTRGKNNNPIMICKDARAPQRPPTRKAVAIVGQPTLPVEQGDLLALPEMNGNPISRRLLAPLDKVLDVLAPLTKDEAQSILRFAADTVIKSKSRA